MKTKIFFMLTICLLFFLTPSIFYISCRASSSNIDSNSHQPEHFQVIPSPPHQVGHRKRVSSSPSTIKERKEKDIPLDTSVVEDSLPQEQSSEIKSIPPSIVFPPHNNFSVVPSPPHDFSTKHFHAHSELPTSIDYLGKSYFTKQKFFGNVTLPKFQTYLNIEIRSLFILERDILGKYFNPFFYYPSYLNPYYPGYHDENSVFLDRFLSAEKQIYSRIHSPNIQQK
ncbi:MAG: hypothetical protein K2W92_06325 [Alphaproteobacteria bacterium]|nr:hypothetical protein [Alphaproteobacteria bacterium]